MGQRLVLTIKDSRLGSQESNDEDYRDSNNLMKLYYHWSGYTNSAQAIMMELAEIIKTVQDEGGDNDAVLKAIIKHVQTENKEDTEFLSKQFPQYQYCCIGGPDGGKDGEEYKYIKNKYPDIELVERPDRAYGLISMSKDGMEQAQMYSEGDCIIDIGTGDCQNWIVWGYDSFDDWAYSCGFADDEKELKEAKERYNNAITVDCDGDEMFNFNYNNPGDKMKATFINTVFEHNDSIYKDKDGRVYEMCR